VGCCMTIPLCSCCELQQHLLRSNCRACGAQQLNMSCYCKQCHSTHCKSYWQLHTKTCFRYLCILHSIAQYNNNARVCTSCCDSTHIMLLCTAVAVCISMLVISLYNTSCEIGFRHGDAQQLKWTYHSKQGHSTPC
jgi:hypothetical protein